MCCRPATKRRPRLTAGSIPALMALALVAAACGKKEPPQPPPSKIPSPISDLTVQQRGMELLLRMGYPVTTIGGLPLETVQAIEVWEMKRIIPAFVGDLDPTLEESLEGTDSDLTTASELATDTNDSATDDTTLVEDVAEVEPEDDPDEGLLFRLADASDEDEPPKEDQIQVDPREFDLVSRLSWRAEEDELQSAVLGDTVVARVSIEEITDVEEVHIFGARVYASDKLVSAASNLAKVLPRQPPPPPNDLSVEPSQRGIKISWESPVEEDSAEGEDEDDESLVPEGFNIYRRESDVREYGLPIFTAPETIEKYTDTSAAFDRKYIYTVTTILSKEPLIESAIGAEYEVNYQDRFPPEAPSEVTALAERGQIRLLWEPSVSDDVVGYVVFRRDPGADFVKISPEPIAGTEYLDRDLPGGRIYGYYVAAIDSADNQSDASDVVEARVP